MASALVPPTIDVEAVEVGSPFEDAVAAGALRWVCARNEAHLRSYFETSGAPFEPGLVQSLRGRKCHIDYAPTLAGFRADADDAPVRELFMNVDGLALLSPREEVFGDVLDISKKIAAVRPPSVHINLGTGRALDASRYREAVAFHYGEGVEGVHWCRSRVPASSNPWTQDFLKSGSVGGETRVLVTRQLFEGRRVHAAAFAPMLDAFSGERYVRSKLSWEGGDLQFARHPLDPSKLVLFFGAAAKPYWGEYLEPGEYAYVLRREFGADLSVDLSGLVPHVDYFVAFLPADRIALVSQPISGRGDLAEAAATAIVERFPAGAAPESLLRLQEALTHPDALRAERERVESLLKQAKREAERGWPRSVEPCLAGRLASHIADLCPGAPGDCFGDAAVEAFLERDPGLFRDWVQASLRDRTEEALDLRMLSVVESQLIRKETPTQERIDRKVQELVSLGFRVVRVPRIGGEESLDVPWSGISYTNGLVLDELLLLPEFGLGPAEQRIFDEIDRALPDRYRIVPVPARHMLLFNGGVHCAVAVIREPEGRRGGPARPVLRTGSGTKP